MAFREFLDWCNERAGVSMTDNEIVKALKAWRESAIEGYEAHLAHGGEIDECEEDFIAITWYALSLINRQKAENERLKHKHDMAVAEREANMKGFLEELNRWNKETQEARAEAIKEFAERLKENIRMNCFCEKYVFEKDIDSLVKEMVGVEE